MKRKILPYNPNLKELARQLRRHMTFSEVKLWSELKNGKMMGYDFDRQRPIGNYIVDFYCKDLMLVMEVDGITHDDEIVIENDAVRQKELEAMGVSFLRFNALDVVHDINNVLITIEGWILDYEQKNGVSEFVLRKRELFKNPNTNKKL